MALNWSPTQRSSVEQALRDFPLLSGECANLARRILPIAVALDPAAQALVIAPRRGRFVCQRGSSHRWFHHVTTATADHRVDALTGIDGCPKEAYLSAYFHFPEELQITPTDLKDPRL